MTDIQTLALLLGQHERQRDAAFADHQRALTLAEAAATQADQLHAYRREYEQRWGAQFQREGQIELVRCYQSFMERLTQAVEQQARAKDQAAAHVQRALVALRDAELRCASVRKLIERRMAEQQIADDRRDQKQIDEQAARAGWGRIGSSGNTRL